MPFKTKLIEFFVGSAKLFLNKRVSGEPDIIVFRFMGEFKAVFEFEKFYLSNLTAPEKPMYTISTTGC